MPNYRRAWHAGGTYFFTVNLLQRHGNDLLTRHVDLLCAVVRSVRGERGIWLRLLRPAGLKSCRPPINSGS